MPTIFSFVMLPLLVALGVFSALMPAHASAAMVCATVVMFVVGCAVLTIAQKLRDRVPESQ
jgi:hypothetical protein